jgi:hypothetical protein
MSVVICVDYGLEWAVIKMLRACMTFHTHAENKIWEIIWELYLPINWESIPTLEGL